MRCIRLVYYHTVIRASFDVYMQGQENMYGGLRTRIYGDLLRGRRSPLANISKSYRDRSLLLKIGCN